MTPTLQGSVCRLFRIMEAESNGKVNSSKRAPQGKGREAAPRVYFIVVLFLSFCLGITAPQCCWCLLHNSVDQLWVYTCPSLWASRRSLPTPGSAPSTQKSSVLHGGSCSLPIHMRFCINVKDSLSVHKHFQDFFHTW